MIAGGWRAGEVANAIEYWTPADGDDSLASRTVVTVSLSWTSVARSRVTHMRSDRRCRTVLERLMPL